MAAKKSLRALLREHGACKEARKWAARYETPAEAWEACGNPEWLLWALEELGLLDERRGRLFACWCARHTPLPSGRTTWDLLTDERSRRAVEVAERCAEGEATEEELSAAENAAWSWSSTVNEATRAVRRATRKAAMDAAKSADESEAWIAAWNAQCGQIRNLWGNPFTQK